MTALSLQVKMVLIGIILALLAIGGWVAYHFYHKDQQDQKIIAVDKVVNQQNQQTITQTAQSDAVTNNTVTKVAVDTQVVNQSQAAIQKAADAKAQQIRDTYNQSHPVSKKSTVSNSITPTAPPVVNARDQMRQQIISIHADALWAAYCDGNTTDPQCTQSK